MKTKIALLTTTLVLAGLAFYASTTVFGQQTPETGQPEKHPRIAQALRDLDHAKTELQHAPDDFGGHRLKAVKAINEAISECNQALAYDKK